MQTTIVSPLLRLPNEILHAIAEDFCNPADIVNLLASCRRLKDKLSWSLLRQNVKSYGATIVPWAAFNGQLDTLKAVHSIDMTLILRRWETGHWQQYASASTGGPEDVRTWSGDTTSFVDLRHVSYPAGKDGLNGISALHVAVAAGQDHIISWLLDNGLEINCQYRGLCECLANSDDWCTSLHLALCQRQDSSAMLLIQRGASVDTISSREPIGEERSGNRQGSLPGPSAIHGALIRGSLDVLRLLLHSTKVDPGATDDVGRTVISLAIELCQDDFSPPCDEIQHILRTVREQIQYLGHHEETKRPQGTAYQQLRLLLDSGTLLNKASPSGIYDMDELLPLHQALFAGDLEAAMLIVDAGADVNAISSGYPPLHCVFFRYDATADALAGHMCSNLLTAGADPNGTTSFAAMEHPRADYYTTTHGATPLMFASRRASLSSILILLSHGATINALDQNGQNAIHWAMEPQGSELFNLNWADTSPSQDEMVATVHLLIQNGCNPTQSSQRGCALEVALEHLHAKYYRGCYDYRLVTEVLDYGCVECVNDENSLDPLQLWLTQGLYDVAEVVVSQGAVLSESLVVACCEYHALWEERYEDFELTEGGSVPRGEHDGLIRFRLRTDGLEPYYTGPEYYRRMILFARKHGVFGEQLTTFLANCEDARFYLAESKEA